ncbi:hypothetical protein N7471_001058 [Penicillium samsonianum]|uniref:uncharacterized protein n=1 Tax=Penicillium samsonianum TaxID=1882272 RepID=UPI002548F72A|nr:uncharacterized protein N7471_001058 [Penicillium samsonianum]KAJ6149859.1 hypothetical protein N7471_001058 [Penicillium samsonianum]
MYGKIEFESARVLTHKNCGFVNFDRLDSAVQAKSLLNGKEIFPRRRPRSTGRRILRNHRNLEESSWQLFT